MNSSMRIVKQLISVVVCLIGVAWGQTPDPSGLSQNCLNLYCDVLAHYGSCDVLVGDAAMQYTCAKYFLGNLMKCPNFPPPDETFMAPSVCADEIGIFASALSGQTLPNPMDIVFNSNSTQLQSCKKNCYESYLFYASQFFDQCEDQVGLVPQLAGLTPYQQFRGQACTTTLSDYEEYPVNCIDAGSKMVSADQTNYFTALGDVGCLLPAQLGANDYDLFLKGLCQEFSALKCCAANQFTLFTQQVMYTLQDPESSTVIEYVPPCLANYLTSECPAVQLDAFCADGAVLEVSTTRIHVQMRNMGSATIPDLYVAEDIDTLMATVATPLVGGISYHPSLAILPIRQTVSVYNFSYINSDGEFTTESTPRVLKTDFNTADGLDFWFQVTLGGAGDMSSSIQANASESLTQVLIDAYNCEDCDITVASGAATFTPVYAFDVPGSPYYNKGGGGDDGDGLSRQGFTTLVGCLLGVVLLVPISRSIAKAKVYYYD